MISFSLIIAFVLCIVGTYTDLKWREIPDWLNYFGILSGVGIGVIVSISSASFSPLIGVIIGGFAGFVIGCVMFYSGQWGGGDSKLLIALGVLLGVQPEYDLLAFFNQPFFVFLLWLVVCGGVYGLIWTIFLAVKNRKEFVKSFSVIAFEARWIRRIVVVGVGVSLLVFIFTSDVFLRVMLGSVIILVPLMMYAFILTKAVERSCMISFVSPKVITVGDWIAKDVVVKGKYICGPKDLGISKKNLSLLLKLHKQKKVLKVWLKTGIPFVPSFLLALIGYAVFGSLF